jgi:hypothetical protein
VQRDASHPGKQGGGPKKNNQKKWRAKEEEGHKGLLTQNKTKKLTPFNDGICTVTICKLL